MTRKTSFSAHFKAKILLPFLLLLPFFVEAQGDMRFFGTATKDNKPLPGATVTVLMDGKQIHQVTTGKNGKFKFTLDINHDYRINFSAPGCVDMYMTLDLHTPPDKAWIYPDYVSDIPFFSAGDPKVKTELFAQKPFIKVIFDGGQGFKDDPTYRFIDEIFKDPMEEQRKKEELARKQAADKARQDSIDLANKMANDALLAQQEADRRRKEEEDKSKNHPANNPPADGNTNVPTMESDEIRLEKEKQEQLAREKQNKTIRAQYENNLLKLVAESEKKTNISKFNKMKDEAMTNSVIEAMRREAEAKAQGTYLIEQQKEKQRQTLANRQIRAEEVSRLIVTVAQIEKTLRVSGMKPVAASEMQNYAPLPNVVVTYEDGFFSDRTSTVFTWPGGKRIIYNVIEFWWGGRYYYREGAEIDQKTYDAEIFRNKRS
ncbi:MAG TPA: carboxypeptidase regulatory-like domain-containing protein [Bacteroidia bacterium]|nr:carboxypeptidase regulatory-like domain-containing protein [Bacteroidia bacterium]